MRQEITAGDSGALHGVSIDTALNGVGLILMHRLTVETGCFSRSPRMVPQQHFDCMWFFWAVKNIAISRAK
jgi:hypothetical protein